MKGPFLIQVMDAEGFWCNHYESGDYKHACALAQAEATWQRKETRVVTGPKREVARTFQPVAQ